MIYLKSDGTPSCEKVIDAFYQEVANVGTSVFSTGEAVVRTKDTIYNIDKKEGTKVIDFSFLTKLLSNSVEDINRINYMPWLEPTVDEIISSPRDIEYCILIPNIDRNEPASLRSKIVNDMKVKLHSKCKIKRVPTYYNSHKSNPYQFVMNDRDVSLLSLDKEMTVKL